MPPAVVAAVMIVGTLVQSYGMYQQGQAAKAEGRYNARVEARNAQQEKLDAKTRQDIEKANQIQDTIEVGERARQLRREGTAKQAKTTSQLNRQGLSLSSVSLADSLESQAISQEQEALGMRRQLSFSNAASRQRGRAFRRDEQMAVGLGKDRANLHLLRGKNSGRSATIGAIGTGISGVASAGSTYTQLSG